MRCVDVNILDYAHRPEAPRHAEYRDWLEAARSGVEPLGLAAIVASGFLRVVTHPRIFREPTPLEAAIEFVVELRRSPALVGVLPGAFLAAIAVEQGATWVSAACSFAGHPGLQWLHPVDHSSGVVTS